MCEITNVKVSILIKPISLDIVVNILTNKNIEYKNYNNYIVFKKIFTYILFKKGKHNHNHVNVTKISTLFNINNVLKEIKELINCEIIKTQIDNIIATYSLNKELILKDIILKKIFEKTKYNNEKFPGLFVKFEEGTAIIFHSGKIVLVGCKSIENLKCLLNKIIVNI